MEDLERMDEPDRLERGEFVVCCVCYGDLVKELEKIVALLEKVGLRNEIAPLVTKALEGAVPTEYRCRIKVNG